MKKIFVLLLLNFFSCFVFGQSTVNVQIKLLTPNQIGDVTLDQKKAVDYVSLINNTLKDHLKTVESNNEVMVLISLHKEQNATLRIGSRPELPDTVINSLNEKLNEIVSPRTKIVDYSLLLWAIINEGCNNPEISFKPEITTPSEQDYLDFQNLSLKEKKQNIEQWIHSDVIPILSAYQSDVKPEFEGVLSIGQLTNRKDYKGKDVDDITYKNEMYWQAVMEMSSGNQLIPFSKICMHLANGEFDKASRLLEIIKFFSDKDTLPRVYYEALEGRIDAMNDELTKEINKGVKMHDIGQYKKAIQHYEKLLEIFPNSAWLQYELYFSKTAKSTMSEGDRIWSSAKNIIYECDPMYPINARASSKKEAYLLFRRQETNNLFKSRETIKEDIIKYADIALDSENYGFAAQLYWLVYTHFNEEDYQNRNILAHFLFCLDKLGNSKSRTFFEGDFKLEFEKIALERKKIMEESAIFNSFAK